MNVAAIAQFRQQFVDALCSTPADSKEWQEQTHTQAYTFALRCDCGGEMHFQVQTPLVHQFLNGKITARELLPDRALHRLAKWGVEHMRKGGKLRKGIAAIIGNSNDAGLACQN